MKESKYKIYKLHYTDKATGDADLLAKGVYEVIEGENIYTNGTQAVVYIGKLEDKEKVGITENDPPIYQEGVFYDVMTTAEIDFGDAEVFPEKYAHTFAGYSTHPETEEENE
jgi:hypothetical protein